MGFVDRVQEVESSRKGASSQFSKKFDRELMLNSIRSCLKVLVVADLILKNAAY